MTWLFLLLVAALSGLVVGVLTGNWPWVALCAGLTLLAATGIVAVYAERRLRLPSTRARLLPMDYAPDGRQWTGSDADRIAEAGRCNALVDETETTVKGYCYLSGEHRVHHTWSEAAARYYTNRLPGPGESW